MATEEVAGEALPRVVQPKGFGGRFLRLFGSLGVDGDGTEFELEHVDPFLMCDYICFDGGAMQRPPFCAHPHSGAAVATVLVEGEDMRPWDNVGGYEGERLQAGGVYVICTGRGCVHDEGPEPFSTEQRSGRAPFGFPGEDGPARSFRMFQLWFDPGHVHAAEGLPPRSSQVLPREAVPLLTSGSLKLRLLIGSYGGQTGADLPVTVLHGGLLPFLGSGRLQIPAHARGFLFCLRRGLRAAALGCEFDVPEHHELVLPPQASEYELLLEVAHGEALKDAQADDALELLVGFGTPVGKPFYKLLGYGGALVAAREDEVRALMRKYEQDPRNFGVDQSAAGAADTSRYGLQVGYKDPLDGRGECQRLNPSAMAPEARWFELERGPYQPKGKGKGKGAGGAVGA